MEYEPGFKIFNVSLLELIAKLFSHIHMYVDTLCDLVSPSPFPALEESKQESQVVWTGRILNKYIMDAFDIAGPILSDSEYNNVPLQQISQGQTQQELEGKKVRLKNNNLYPVSEEIFKMGAFSTNIYDDEMSFGILLD